MRADLDELAESLGGSETLVTARVGGIDMARKMGKGLPEGWREETAEELELIREALTVQIDQVLAVVSGEEVEHGS